MTPEPPLGDVEKELELREAKRLLYRLAVGGHTIEPPNGPCAAIGACNCGRFAIVREAEADALRFLRGNGAVISK